VPLSPVVDLKVLIEPDLPPVVPDAVSFETGATRGQAADPSLFVYEHHGQDFSTSDPGALTSLFEDLVLGRALPLTFATPALQDVDTLVAVALFLQRELAVHPDMPPFVYTVDFVHRRGFPALAHIEQDLARFLCFLRNYFPEKGLSKREFGERLQTACSWVRDYVVDRRFPHLGAAPAPIRVLQQGTNGFAVAEAQGALIDGWVQLYQQGFLRGLVVSSPVGGGRRRMLGARKSHYVDLDLNVASRLLNEMERAMGELPDWESDGLWLKGPEDGSLLLVSHVLDVLIRV
jgi:hypothetical protein